MLAVSARKICARSLSGVGSRGLLVAKNLNKVGFQQPSHLSAVFAREPVQYAAIRGLATRKPLGADEKSHKESYRERNRTFAKYCVATVLFTVAMTYLAVPLYRKFCQVTGYGGTVQEATHDALEKLLAWQKANPEKAAAMRHVTIRFNADVSAGMAWDFQPSQEAVRVKIGEPALAFFLAKSRLPVASTGVATYNVTPMRAGLYFNKVQCFCFDEQRLQAGEEVEMPVWFFIDPRFADDPKMDPINELVLSYTFWPSEIEAPEDGEQNSGNSKDSKEPEVCPLPPIPLPPRAPAASASATPSTTAATVASAAPAKPAAAH